MKSNNIIKVLKIMLIVFIVMIIGLIINEIIQRTKYPYSPRQIKQRLYEEYGERFSLIGKIENEDDSKYKIKAYPNSDPNIVFEVRLFPAPESSSATVTFFNYLLNTYWMSNNYDTMVLEYYLPQLTKIIPQFKIYNSKLCVLVNHFEEIDTIFQNIDNAKDFIKNNEKLKNIDKIYFVFGEYSAHIPTDLEITDKNAEIEDKKQQYIEYLREQGLSDRLLEIPYEIRIQYKYNLLFTEYMYNNNNIKKGIQLHYDEEREEYTIGIDKLKHLISKYYEIENPYSDIIFTDKNGSTYKINYDNSRQAYLVNKDNNLIFEGYSMTLDETKQLLNIEIKYNFEIEKLEVNML